MSMKFATNSRFQTRIISRKRRFIPYDYVDSSSSTSLSLPFFRLYRGSHAVVARSTRGAKERFSTPSSTPSSPTTAATTSSSSPRFSTGRTSLGPEPAYSFQKLAPDLRGQLFNQFHPLSGRYRHHIGYSRYGTADDDSGGRGQLKSL